MSATLAAALAGAVIGGLLSGLGFWYRVRVERLARINEALFYLVELYRIVRIPTVIDYRYALEVYFSELERQFPGRTTKEDREKISPMIRDLIREIQSAQGAEFNDAFADRFSEACLSVAPHSPLLAARINSNRLLRLIIPVLEKYNEALRVAAEADSSELAKEEINRATEIAQKNISSEIVKELRKDVSMVASRASVATWIICQWRFFWKTDKRLKANFRKFIERKMPELVKEYQDENLVPNDNGS